MTEGERGIAPDWQSWAMDCLTDAQLSHCGHLDCGVVVDGCEFCAELVAHIGHELGQVAPDCEWCSERACTCPSARWTPPGHKPFTLGEDCARHGKEARATAEAVSR